MGGERSEVALCHEWLGDRHGSEKTFEAMASAVPTADLFALTWDRSSRFDFGGREPRTTALGRLPHSLLSRKAQLPMMPLAWRYASRQRYRVVVTSSHACAKGFWPGREAVHLCYCYTPMRYAWLPDVDQRATRAPARATAERLFRRWDKASARWVDEFAAISTVVRDRVRRFYSRDAAVVPPPVDTAFYTPAPSGTRRAATFVLVASRLVPYKRIDVAVRAAHLLAVPLVVAGAGPEEARLRALARTLGARVSFRIAPDDEALRGLYRSASALVFPGTEDFGIVPVEAQACGTPVVAFAAGGALDTVVPGVTGVLPGAQTSEAFAAGIVDALDMGTDEAACRASAERFSADQFLASFRAWVTAASARQGADVELDAPAR